MRLTFVAAAALAFTASAFAQNQPVIGLITKTETNPFFVKMKEGAAEAAKAKGAKLLTGAGKGFCSGHDNVTPSGTPACTKPMNNGTAEQEQNGVTIPKAAASTLAKPSLRPASEAREARVRFDH